MNLVFIGKNGCCGWSVEGSGSIAVACYVYYRGKKSSSLSRWTSWRRTWEGSRHCWEWPQAHRARRSTPVRCKYSFCEVLEHAQSTLLQPSPWTARAHAPTASKSTRGRPPSRRESAAARETTRRGAATRRRLPSSRSTRPRATPTWRMAEARIRFAVSWATFTVNDL